MEIDREPSRPQTQGEKDLVESFKHYIIPTNVYNALAERARSKPYILRRSFSYSQASAGAENRSKSQRHRSVLVTISLPTEPVYEDETGGPFGNLPVERVSVIAVLSHQPVDGSREYVPCSAALMHVPVKENGVSVPLRLPTEQSLASDFCVILIVARDCMDKTGIGILHGTQLVPRLTEKSVFSLLKAGERVLWGVSSLVKPASNKVALQPATLRVHCAGTAVNGHPPREKSSIRFRTHTRGGQPSMTVQVGLGMIDADMPLPPHLRAPREPGKLEGPAGRIRGVEGRRGPASCGTVYLRFLSPVTKHYVVEIVTNFSCPFCRLQTRSFLGLTQHLEASHDLFVYGYPKDSNALPVVSLEPREDIYNASSAFQDPEAKNMRDPVNKEFSFFCPPSQRKLRVQQYRSDGRKRPPFPVPFSTAPAVKRARLTLLASARSPDGAADLQDLNGEGVPVVRRRRRAAAAPVVLDPIENYHRFYHARMAVQMTQEEMIAIMANPKAAPDSDDEEDLEAWKGRCRRKLAPKSDLCQMEKVFMFNWNVHMRNHPVHADAQVPECCMSFSRINHAVLSTNPAIRRVFVLHLVNLYEYGLLTPDQIDDCLRVLDEPILEPEPSPDSDVEVSAPEIPAEA